MTDVSSSTVTIDAESLEDQLCILDKVAVLIHFSVDKCIRAVIFYNFSSVIFYKFCWAGLLLGICLRAFCQKFD